MRSRLVRVLRTEHTLPGSDVARLMVQRGNEVFPCMWFCRGKVAPQVLSTIIAFWRDGALQCMHNMTTPFVIVPKPSSFLINLLIKPRKHLKGLAGLFSIMKQNEYDQN